MMIIPTIMTARAESGSAALGTMSPAAAACAWKRELKGSSMANLAGFTPESLLPIGRRMFCDGSTAGLRMSPYGLNLRRQAEVGVGPLAA